MCLKVSQKRWYSDFRMNLSLLMQKDDLISWPFWKMWYSWNRKTSWIFIVPVFVDSCVKFQFIIREQQSLHFCNDGPAFLVLLYVCVCRIRRHTLGCAQSMGFVQFERWLHRSLAVWFWENLLTFLRLTLVWKIDTVRGLREEVKQKDWNQQRARRLVNTFGSLKGLTI